MYTAVKQTLLEDVLPPKKLLYLCDATLTNTANDIAECIGNALASYHSASPNYMRETAIVWGRYKSADGGEVDPVHADYGTLRLRYAAKIFGTFASVTAPPAPLNHCRALVRLLTRMAAITSFTRTGDMMVHKLIMTMIDPNRAARLSISETPFHLAGEHFGENANRVVRGLFERNIATDFKETEWQVEASVAETIFFLAIMFEAGEDLGVPICCNHEVAMLEARKQIAFCCWHNKAGFIAQERIVWSDPSSLYPIPSMVLACLEMIAISGTDGVAGAESLLCAVKTPEKVTVRTPRPFMRA